nr:protein YgfX [Methylomonas sp.]
MAVDLLHLLAILACVLNSLPILYQSLLLAAVVTLWWTSWKYWKTSGLLLRYTKSNGWEMAFDGADFVAGQVLADTVITRWVIFLSFKTNTQSTMSVLIANDALSADDFRLLRVSLTLSGCERN